MATEMPNIALTEREILRRHAFYQTSYTGNQLQPTRRSWSPSSIQTTRKTYKKNKSVSLSKDQKTTAPSQPSSKHDFKTVAGTTKHDFRTVTNTTKREIKTVVDRLDVRRQARSERVRPWLDETQRPKTKRENSKLFYDKTLPTYLEGANVLPKPRQYVANTKYGKIYEVRPGQTKKRSRVSSPARWLWEDEFLLWNSSRQQYLEETTKRTKPVADVSQSSVVTNSFTANTPRRSLPIINTNAVNNPAVNSRAVNSSKGIRPNATIYANIRRSWTVYNFRTDPKGSIG